MRTFEALDENDELKEKKNAKQKNEPIKSNETDKKDDNPSSDEDEFNVSLAKMEEEIKPKIINILDSLNKNYLKLKKYQIEKLNCILEFKTIICFKK